MPPGWWQFDKNISMVLTSKAPFTLEIYFEILFRNKNFEIFSFKSKHFHIGNKLSKANVVDASFDVCKHWPTDQSQRSTSEISSVKCRKIEQCSKLRNTISKFIFFESLLFTLEIFLRKELININFEINFQCERGLTNASEARRQPRFPCGMGFPISVP